MVVAGRLLQSTTMRFGIDVSHHQDPRSLPWSRFEGVVDFVICRAAFGAGLRDRHVAEHVRRARAIGAAVGLYSIYRPVHGIDAQWELLRATAEDVDTREGDIVPALAIEHDPLPRPGRDVHSSWSSPCEDLAARICAYFGNVLIHITPPEWTMLGRPQWVLTRPLWIAHYTRSATPATLDGAQPTVWQYRVGPFDPRAPGGYVDERPDLDHNLALAKLPLIGALPRVTLPDDRLDELRDDALRRLWSAEIGAQRNIPT